MFFFSQFSNFLASLLSFLQPSLASVHHQFFYSQVLLLVTDVLQYPDPPHDAAGLAWAVAAGFAQAVAAGLAPAVAAVLAWAVAVVQQVWAAGLAQWAQAVGLVQQAQAVRLV